MERNSIEKGREREREGQKESKIRKKREEKGGKMESLSAFSCLLSLLIWENPPAFFVLHAVDSFREYRPVIL